MATKQELKTALNTFRNDLNSLNKKIKVHKRKKYKLVVGAAFFITGVSAFIPSVTKIFAHTYITNREIFDSKNDFEQINTDTFETKTERSYLTIIDKETKNSNTARKITYSFSLDDLEKEYYKKVIIDALKNKEDIKVFEKLLGKPHIRFAKAEEFEELATGDGEYFASLKLAKQQFIYLSPSEESYLELFKKCEIVGLSGLAIVVIISVITNKLNKNSKYGTLKRNKRETQKKIKEIRGNIRNIKRS
jgi:hypothetical protein